ncbi:MAG TPA: CHASE3 domain-containing protein [Candidatus Limnocylindrales bacterium]|nr:CHASE3 domain-containing protein [Candidatus Limnocylindrales bacterium]
MTSAREKKSGSNGGNAIARVPSAEPSQNWTQRYSAGRLLTGVSFVLAILSLAVVVVGSRLSEERLREATRAVTHTREVLEKLGEISTHLSEVESGARSFAISGKQSHLDPFYTAAKAVPDDVAELEALLRDDPAALSRVSEIEPVINKHIKAMKDMVDLGNKNLFRGSAQRKLTDQGNMLMEEIRTAFGALEKTQRARLAQQQIAMTARAERVTMIGLAGSMLAGVLVLGFGALGLHAINGKAKIEQKLERLLGSMPDALVIVNAEGKIISSNAQTGKLFGYTERELQGENMALLVPERIRQTQRQYYAGFFLEGGDRVAETTMELCGLRKDGREFPVEISTKPLVAEKGRLVTSAIRDISERKQAEKQISRLNKELRDRAAELEAANKELEAFSYSVSHDLRSPLQNIDSFSQILIEEYANRLDADGRDYVQRLRGSCQHMEEIIDALLVLSNMARHELVPDRVDLSTLANAVATELKQKDPDRLVDWVIAEGLTVEGDTGLLRVVLENLFGNAWKFTAKRPRARIEFGALPQCNGARTYFVRDDGAGFDMARASQLFAPFKRLHDQSQFRGTGIGLATVQRVIRRHRGKIWAESAVDKGATFCFTLTDEAATSNGKDHPPTKPI